MARINWQPAAAGIAAAGLVAAAPLPATGQAEDLPVRETQEYTNVQCALDTGDGLLDASIEFNGEGGIASGSGSIMVGEERLVADPPSGALAADGGYSVEYQFRNPAGAPQATLRVSGSLLPATEPQSYEWRQKIGGAWDAGEQSTQFLAATATVGEATGPAAAFADATPTCWGEHGKVVLRGSDPGAQANRGPSAFAACDLGTDGSLNVWLEGETYKSVLWAGRTFSDGSVATDLSASGDLQRSQSSLTGELEVTAQDGTGQGSSAKSIAVDLKVADRPEVKLQRVQQGAFFGTFRYRTAALTGTLTLPGEREVSIDGCELREGTFINQAFQ